MGFFKQLAKELLEAGSAYGEAKRKEEEAIKADMEAKGYVYNSYYETWEKPGTPPPALPKLFDKNGRQIPPDAKIR